MIGQKLRVNFYLSDIIALLIFILTTASLFNSLGVKFLDYLDEAVALAGMVIIILALILGRYNKTDKAIIALALIIS